MEYLQLFVPAAAAAADADDDESLNYQTRIFELGNKAHTYTLWHRPLRRREAPLHAPPGTAASSAVPCASGDKRATLVLAMHPKKIHTLDKK